MHSRSLIELLRGQATIRASGKKIVDKRAAIIDAAVALFARYGFFGATVPDIAERAGVATGTIYRYLDSRKLWY